MKNLLRLRKMEGSLDEEGGGMVYCMVFGEGGSADLPLVIHVEGGE